MNQPTQTYRGRATAILIGQLVFLCVMGFLGWSLKFDNRIDRFAVADMNTEAAYNTLKTQFGEAEFFMVALKFRPEAKARMVRSGETLFAELAALPGVPRYYSWGRLIPPGLPVSPNVSPFPFFRPEQGLYVAIFELQGGDRNREAHLGAILTAARGLEAVHGDLLERIVIAGEPVVNHELNQSSREVKAIFFPILISLSLLLLAGLFRCWKVLLVSGLAVGSSLAGTMGLMALTGQTLNLVTTLVPTLIFVLAVAMQVHVLIGIALFGSIQAGLRKKFKPNFLVTLTTSIGFGSLMTSRVGPISDMGLYMAIGLWLIFFWSHVTHWGISVLVNLHPPLPRLAPLTKLACAPWYRHAAGKKRLSLLPLAVILLGGWWLVRNPVESNGLNYFEPNHPIRNQTAFLQEFVTGASYVEILVAREVDPAREAESSGQLAALEASLEELQRVRHLLSENKLITMGAQLLNLSPRDNAVRGRVEDWLTHAQPGLLERFRGENYHRVQLLVNSMDLETYHAFKTDLLRLVERDLRREAIITGNLDRIILVQQYLLESLTLSLGISVALVVIMLIFLLGKGHQTLVILIPNLFPLGCMALSMGLLAIKTNISTIMAFSVSFGIAVDNSIHLLHTFDKREELGFWERWEAALSQDVRAIFLTTLTLTCGFFVLAFSSFIPTRSFGFLMAVGMVFALLGNVFFLPVLLKVGLHFREKVRVKPKPVRE